MSSATTTDDRQLPIMELHGHCRQLYLEPN
jgi:hypothetical protein